MADKITVLEDVRLLIDTLTNTKELDREEAAVVSDTETIADMVRKLVEENAHAVITHDEYNCRYTELMARYDIAKKWLMEIEEQRSARKARKRDLEVFCRALEAVGPLLEFNEEVFNGTMCITLFPDFSFTCCYKNYEVFNGTIRR